MNSPPNFSAPADQTGNIVCGQCGAPMPRGMRFCRSCGNRLGEGPAEYTETVRFPNGQTAPGARGTTPFYAAPLAQAGTTPVYCARRRRMRGMTWVWIVIAIFFASVGGLRMLVKNVGRLPRGASTSTGSRSAFGVDGL